MHTSQPRTLVAELGISDEAGGRGLLELVSGPSTRQEVVSKTRHAISGAVSHTNIHMGITGAAFADGVYVLL